MGDKDSTKTRVTPVFNELSTRDPRGWLAPLLSLPARDGAATARPISPTLRPGTLQYGTEEARLEPPPSLLRWMIEHPDALERPKQADKQGETTKAKRKALLAGDTAVRDEALALLARSAPAQAWYVLEGRSRPDVYLETDDAVVVIEGKRTERGPTTATSWLPHRDQMLRHLDAASERLAGRRLYGFFIVGEADEVKVPKAWQKACVELVTPAYLAASLPHRSAAEREAIAAAFLGATTWRRVCDALAVAGVV